jgi:hypothetical protein
MSASNFDQIGISAYTEAAPSKPAPRHPIRSHASGVNASKKPAKPLRDKHDQHFSLPNCSHQSITDLQRRWVAKGLAKVSSHISLRREIELFKELLGHHHTSSGLQLRKLSLPEGVRFDWRRHGVICDVDGYDYIKRLWYTQDKFQR